MSEIIIDSAKLTLADCRRCLETNCQIVLDKSAINRIKESRVLVDELSHRDVATYGINTGFGALAKQRISPQDLAKLQRNLILSHAAGVGDYFSTDVVRLIFLLKIASLSQGFSGVRVELVLALVQLFNARIYPCIPMKGSVGASGDLAPLSHLSLALLGEGLVHFRGEIISAEMALAEVGMQPIELAAKEGLALANGLQASTALAVKALIEFEDVFAAAVIAGAMTLDAAQGSLVPFDARISQCRGHQGQIDMAKLYEELMQDSEIMRQHHACDKVQDPYSLRCQPQIMGACLEQMRFVAQTLRTEINAVSDNPLVFVEDKQILSGGNFHGQMVAFAADNLALAIAEVGSLAERRVALLVDERFSGLPPFLVKESGVNSGFMIPQVTCAALVCENKSLSHPASVDSLPTSANQEDHVSMATYAARRLLSMVSNCAYVVAIELMAAAQGLDFRAPIKTSPALERVKNDLRQITEFVDQDRYLSPEIEQVKTWIMAGKFHSYLTQILLPTYIAP